MGSLTMMFISLLGADHFRPFNAEPWDFYIRYIRGVKSLELSLHIEVHEEISDAGRASSWDATMLFYRSILPEISSETQNTRIQAPSPLKPDLTSCQRQCLLGLSLGFLKPLVG